MRVEALPAEALPVEALPAEALPAEALPAEALPAEALPAEALPAEALPAEALPAEALPAAPVQEAVPATIEAVRPGVPEPSQEMVPIAEAEAVIAAEPVAPPHGERDPDGESVVSPAVDDAVYAPEMTAVDPEMIRQEVKEAVERLVWEMVPDLAEKIVREEIRRLTDLPEER